MPVGAVVISLDLDIVPIADRLRPSRHDVAAGEVGIGIDDSVNKGVYS